VLLLSGSILLQRANKDVLTLYGYYYPVENLTECVLRFDRISRLHGKRIQKPDPISIKSSCISRIDSLSYL
jgi:hypothetical protein